MKLNSDFQEAAEKVEESSLESSLELCGQWKTQVRMEGLHPPCRERLAGLPEELGKASGEWMFWFSHPKNAPAATLTSIKRGLSLKKDVGIFIFMGILRSRPFPWHHYDLFRTKNSEVIQFCQADNLKIC